MSVILNASGIPIFRNDPSVGGALRCGMDTNCCCCSCTVPTRVHPGNGTENDCLACTETDFGTPSTLTGIKFTVAGTGVSRPMNWSDSTFTVFTSPSCTPTIPPIAGTYVFSRDTSFSCVGSTEFLSRYIFDSSGCPATGGTAETAIYRCFIAAYLQPGVGFIVEVSTRMLFLNNSGTVVGGVSPSLSGWTRSQNGLPSTTRQQWRWYPTPPCYSSCNQILTVLKCTQSVPNVLQQNGTMSATHNSWLLTGVTLSNVEIF